MEKSAAFNAGIVYALEKCAISYKPRGTGAGKKTFLSTVRDVAEGGKRKVMETVQQQAPKKTAPVIKSRPLGPRHPLPSPLPHSKGLPFTQGLKRTPSVATPRM